MSYGDAVYLGEPRPPFGDEPVSRTWTAGRTLRSIQWVTTRWPFFAHRQSLVLRRRTVSSKVTDEEYAAFEAIATATNKTVSDWVRDTLLTVAHHESAEHTILGELLALRKILLNLQFTVAAGEPVTRDRMLAWIEEADADKGEKARARLTAAAG